mgnify:CR=1 FL=1
MRKPILLLASVCKPQASTTFNITKKLQAYGQFNYGKGIGSYLNDLSNLNVDIVPDPDKEGKMQVLPMLGWYAGLQYNLCPSIFISGTYSLSRLYSENGYPSENPESYRKGQYLVANAFWNVSSNLQVGVEYLRGWRTDFSSPPCQPVEYAGAVFFLNQHIHKRLFHCIKLKRETAIETLSPSHHY